MIKLPCPENYWTDFHWCGMMLDKRMSQVVFAVARDTESCRPTISRDIWVELGRPKESDRNIVTDIQEMVCACDSLSDLVWRRGLTELMRMQMYLSTPGRSELSRTMVMCNHSSCCSEKSLGNLQLLKRL